MQQARPSPGFRRNPDKKITVAPHACAVTVSAGSTVLATTRQAKRLEEEGYPPVLYIPFDDIRFAALERTESKSHCPYKGDASYWRLAETGAAPDVMWAYEDPYEEMLAIKDHGAFYADRVTFEEH
ncbi:DUF427 domain-containing protein [Chelativorans sp. M5D2P16]|uniref:DUF427 domain-containing protein n=1 Tax=Chelativorans sp. M5D2P16 TaxID=3095678 RepID=UPI002ACA9AEB|nr:DUF427 domain-containing protein [Chelativorans sp. M5D2P16]MDZ5698805.1 DUF427 domain-containing protein [Chelativorans sp. M5D2P16]